MEQLLTVNEVTKILRCSRSYGYYLATSGLLDSVRIGKKLLIKRASLETALQNGLPMANIGEQRP